MGLTDDTLGKGGPLERGQAQVPDLDGACRAGDKDVVTLEIPVKDGGHPGVQEMKTPQDLSAPALKDSGLHLSETPQVSGEGAQPGLWQQQGAPTGKFPSSPTGTVA